MMKIRVENPNNSKKKTTMLCGFVLEDSDKVLGLENVDSKIAPSIKQSINDMMGIFGKISVIPTTGSTTAQRILLAGLGKKEKFTNDTIRFVSGKIAQKARELKLKEFSIIVPPSSLIEPISSVSQILEGCKMSLYTFEKYKSKKENSIPDLTILVSKSEKISKAIKIAAIVSDGAVYTKSIANLPPNECIPATLADFARIISKKNNMKCNIISKNDLKKKGFGGITAVGQGSKNEPKLIILEHNHGSRNEKPVVIVGKAVTFDTGGISLKPGDKMDEMKFDKCGGCTVLGIMKAVSELKLPVNVVGIIPSVENMPGGESYRPGDIVKLYGGSTAEILNTDAEGRLILSDALSYGVKTYKPKAVLDFATLTGACIVALGPNVAGLVSNNNGIASKIRKSSDRTGEQVWQLPLNEDYTDMKKSDYADIKNVGIGRSAGAITAAAFLANAVGTTPWAHFDIAGTAWIQTGTKEKSYNPKGATGFGVRLGVDYLA